MAKDQHEHQPRAAAELLAEAAARPGVADLMAMYQQQAKVVFAAKQYMIRPRPMGLVSSGTAVPGLLV